MGKPAKTHSSKKWEATHVKVYDGNGKGKMMLLTDHPSLDKPK